MTIFVIRRFQRMKWNASEERKKRKIINRHTNTIATFMYVRYIVIANTYNSMEKVMPFFHPFELYKIESTVLFRTLLHIHVLHYICHKLKDIFFVTHIIYLFVHLKTSTIYWCSFSFVGLGRVICVFNWILLFGVYFNSNVSYILL